MNHFMLYVFNLINIIITLTVFEFSKCCISHILTIALILSLYFEWPHCSVGSVPVFSSRSYSTNVSLKEEEVPPYVQSGVCVTRNRIIRCLLNLFQDYSCGVI